MSTPVVVAGAAMTKQEAHGFSEPWPHDRELGSYIIRIESIAFALVWLVWPHLWRKKQLLGPPKIVTALSSNLQNF